jgi:hypothetical protein
VELTAFVQGAARNCIPTGPIQLEARADRYQTTTVSDSVPTQGAITVAIPMDCTMVSGRVVDTASRAVAGAWVFLTDQNGAPLRDVNGNPYQTKTDLNGRFSFACVPHGFVRVTTDADTSARQEKTIGPAGWTNVELTVQTTGATLIVIVVDGATNTRIANAQVVVTTTGGATRSATTSGAPPQATFVDVRPAGSAYVRATATGYTPATVPVSIAVTGTQTVTITLQPDVSVQFPTAFVLQLDWGAAPRDLDLHCSGPDGAARFHCYYANRTPIGYVALDRDDTDTTGPERIAINQVAGAFVPGDYHCWVHNYSGESSFAGSGASVTLLSLDGMSLPTQRGRWEVLAVPGAPDRIWAVVEFTIDAQGTLTINPTMNFRAGTASDVF